MGTLAGSGDGRGVTAHPVPGGTTLAECPGAEILCSAVRQRVYTEGEFGVCVQQPEHLYLAVVLGRSCPILPWRVHTALWTRGRLM